MLKNNKIQILLTILGFILLVILYQLLTSPILYRFELRTLDLRLQILAQKQEHDPKIVQLLLDDYSTLIAQENSELGLGRIPWPRRSWGEVVEFLSRSKPKAIVFDINFLGPEGFSKDNVASDDYFTQSVNKSTSPVFFGVLFTDSLVSLGGNVIELDKEIQNRLIKIPADIRQTLSEKQIMVLDNLSADSIMRSFITYTIYTPIMKGVLTEADGVGAINLKTDIDGVNRKHIPLFGYNEQYFPSLSLAVAHALLPEDNKAIQLTNDELFIGDRVIPLDKEGKNFTTWYGEPKTYQVFHVIDVILAEKMLKRGLKEGEKLPIHPDIFKDKIIIIGQTASGFDIHHTPMANVFVGTEIVATNIDNYLHQQTFISKMDSNYVLLITLLFCVAIWLVVSKSQSTPLSLSLSVFLIMAYILMSIFALTEKKIWVEMVGPVSLLLITFVMTYVMKYVFTSRKLESAIEQATKDGLTKLYNHRFFQERIHRDLSNASRKDDNVSLCLIDIDFFKKFNDTYGHRAGDAVLIQVAQTLKDSVRKSDLVARYGGEEMCVLLDKTGIDEAITVAQKLVDNIANKDFFIDEGTKKVNVTISVGVATYPIHAKTVAELIEFADKCLYRAKEGGRNQVGALEDVITTTLVAGEKQIKEVEIQKSKLIKSLEDFVRICEEKDYNYENYVFELLKEKEVFSEEFLDQQISHEAFDQITSQENEVETSDNNEQAQDDNNSNEEVIFSQTSENEVIEETKA
jgi:diguanylate cyclase (GGDEF)-like protein